MSYNLNFLPISDFIRRCLRVMTLTEDTFLLHQQEGTPQQFKPLVNRDLRFGEKNPFPLQGWLLWLLARKSHPQRKTRKFLPFMLSWLPYPVSKPGSIIKKRLYFLEGSDVI